ncbi:MAG: T9SS type B sorting domain-containing protein [Bacteroidota bacterium]
MMKRRTLLIYASFFLLTAFIPVQGQPVANDITLTQCDGNPIDGFSLFNLAQAIPDITGGASGVTVSFHETMMNAENDTSPLNSDNYTNTVANLQIIFARVEDAQTGDYAVSQVTLEVNFDLVLGGVLNACSNNGFATFALSDADDQVLFLLGGAASGYTVTYYSTQEDALLGVNPLGDDYVNEDAYSQVITAKVEDGGDCFGISSVLLTVNILPVIAGNEEVIYCLNDFPNTMTLASGFLVGSEFDYTYEWSTGEITESIEINTPGIYDVTITNIDNCSATRTITVTASDIATFESIEITDFSENNTVTVNISGEGDYEYALNDNLGPYQDSNYFENVPAGFHTVYVRDKNNCGFNQQDIAVIGYPKFFTPNADGINDTWQLSGTDVLFQPNSRISIFDRYGKLLAQLRPTSSWDGTYNGTLMPSSDYWFRIQLEDGREFKGHFTLKR